MTREMFVIAAVAFLFGAAGHRQLRLNRPAPVTATTVNIAGVLGRWPCAQRSIEPEKSIGASVKRESPNKQHCNNQQQSADDGHTAVWTGSEMITWGGFDASVAISTQAAGTIWAQIVGHLPALLTHPLVEVITRQYGRGVK